jgi:hypothetical protein
MKDDKAIEDIRRVRKQISKECDFDPHKLVQHYMRRQTENAQRLRKTGKRSSISSES